MGVHASTTPTDPREQMANPVVSVAVRNTSPRCVLLGAGNPIGRNGSREKVSQDDESDDFLDDSSADKTGGSHISPYSCRTSGSLPKHIHFSGTRKKDK